ncbi:hypothetical protein [Candidatus Hodgkinia cicadicola]
MELTSFVCCYPIDSPLINTLWPLFIKQNVTLILNMAIPIMVGLNQF